MGHRRGLEELNDTFSSRKLHHRTRRLLKQHALFEADRPQTERCSSPINAITATDKQNNRHANASEVTRKRLKNWTKMPKYAKAVRASNSSPQHNDAVRSPLNQEKNPD
jgi:hypothetical protein